MRVKDSNARDWLVEDNRQPSTHAPRPHEPAKSLDRGQRMHSESALARGMWMLWFSLARMRFPVDRGQRR